MTLYEGFCKDYYMFYEKFQFATTLNYVYGMNDMQGLVQDLQVIKYAGCNMILSLTSRVWFKDVTRLFGITGKPGDLPYGIFPLLLSFHFNIFMFLTLIGMVLLHGTIR